MPRFLEVKNWRQFQHYTDRRPPWIKCYVALLDDLDFLRLSDGAQAGLVRLWLLAARLGHPLPNDQQILAARGSVKPKHIKELVSSGWLIETDAREEEVKWASRHVSPETRARILERDGQRCRACGATQSLEIDHIVPISRGGDGRDDNLQVLCRPCNRRKRSKTGAEVEQQSSSGPAGVLPRARERADARSREGEGEREREGEQQLPLSISARVREALPTVARPVFDQLAGDQPDALARALTTAHTPLTGGPSYSWAQIGEALVDYAAKRHREFAPVLFKRFLETNARPPVARRAASADPAPPTPASGAYATALGGS